MKKILLALLLPLFLNACGGDDKNQIKFETVDFSGNTSQADLYNTKIKTLVDAQCSSCHGKNLKAASTDLLFVKGDDAKNLTVLQGFINSEGGERLVDKATGKRHGGGKQIVAGSPEAQALTELASRVTSK